jgi:ArsR family transcriptional regulator
MAGRGKAPRSVAPSSDGSGRNRAVKELSEFFKSLADESRLKILFMLAEHGELNVSSIGEQLGQSQPAVSHHLTQLKAAGLVEYRREGKFNFYSLHPTGAHRLLDRLFPDGGPARLSLGGVDVTFKRR